MYEVELTARINDRDSVVERIEKLAPLSRKSLRYDDAYFDREEALAQQKQELRIRTKTNTETGSSLSLLTFKDSPFDDATQSKPENETQIAAPLATKAILEGLGFRQSIAYVKDCDVFEVVYEEITIEIAVVKIKELPSHFIEMEAQTEDFSKTQAYFAILYRLLDKLGIPEENLTTECYIDLVRQARAQS